MPVSLDATANHKIRMYQGFRGLCGTGANLEV